VDAGEVFAILGASAGQDDAARPARAAPGEPQPARGGQELVGADDDTRRRGASWAAFQSGALFDLLTLAENVVLIQANVCLPTATEELLARVTSRPGRGRRPASAEISRHASAPASRAPWLWTRRSSCRRADRRPC
jgi:hypothetical protein